MVLMKDLLCVLTAASGNVLLKKMKSLTLNPSVLTSIFEL